MRAAERLAASLTMLHKRSRLFISLSDLMSRAGQSSRWPLVIWEMLRENLNVVAAAADQQIVGQIPVAQFRLDQISSVQFSSDQIRSV